MPKKESEVKIIKHENRPTKMLDVSLDSSTQVVKKDDAEEDIPEEPRDFLSSVI